MSCASQRDLEAETGRSIDDIKTQGISQLSPCPPTGMSVRMNTLHNRKLNSHLEYEYFGLWFIHTTVTYFERTFLCEAL